MNRSPLPNLDDSQRAELRRRVEAAMHREKRALRWIMFFASLGIGILFAVIAIVIAATTPAITEAFARADDPTPAILILPLIAAFLGILFQGIGLAYDSGLGDREMRTRLTRSELSDMLMDEALGSDDDLVGIKRKRDETTYRLSDDGEIIPDSDLELNPNAVDAGRRASR